MTQKTRMILLAIDVLLIILTIGFIFSNSLKDVEQSTNASEKVMDTVINTVPPVRDAIESDRITLGFLEEIIRSLAHVAEFILLGALTVIFLLLSKIRPLSISAYLPFFFCLLVGIADECLQLTNDRACEVVDVIKDFAGSVIGGALVFAVFGIMLAVKHRKKLKGTSK